MGIRNLQTFTKSSTELYNSFVETNSFGLMDGGIDYYISEYYGGVNQLIPLVQRNIEEEWCGEQNVGTCLLIDVKSLAENIKSSADEGTINIPRYIAHSPTMRTPKSLHSDDDIVYRCMWAVLTTIRKHNANLKKNEERINKVICAGFGTGVGQFPEEACAKQMALAVKNFVESSANNSIISKEQEVVSSNFLVNWSYAGEIESRIQILLNNKY
ncbi:hypothetical protein G9A89_015411 [Geosiphon pyriformis]|nr:hypothetical protein G9A89_015411 [Geosiphon pyriformis]